MKHFWDIIKAFHQDQEDWWCKKHERFVVKNGKWKPCTPKNYLKKGNNNCVIGMHKKHKQLPLWK